MVQRRMLQCGLCRSKEKWLKPGLKCVNRWSSSTVQRKRVPESWSSNRETTSSSCPSCAAELTETSVWTTATNETDCKNFYALTHFTQSNNLILQQFTQTRGLANKLVKSRSSHDICKYFFTNRTVDVWNSLPNDIVSVQSTQAFKYKVSHLNV